MLRSKLDIDKHVENCLKKIHSQAERNQRYFSFARLYFNIGEYEQAQRYLSSYLSTKPKSAEGYQLFGKTLEKLGKKDAALEAYRTSLQLDPKQNNLVIKVCELLAADDVNLDQSGARYFCEMAQSFDPTNPAVFSLKERLIVTENKNPHEVSNLLLRELEDRPTDANLRIRLLQHFLQHNMIQEAYKHVCDIENRNLNIFTNNIKWYEVVAEILVRYQRDTSLKEPLTWQFWFISVSVMDKLVALSLDERSDNVKLCSDYTNTLFNFDQSLQKASQNIDSCPDRQLAQEFLTHYRGQLCFHLVTLIYKQAKKDLIKFKDARNITLPVLFAAFHTQPVDLQSLWVTHSPEERRSMVQRWNKEASFRCSQTGHMLLSLAKDRKMTLVEKAQQYSSGVWRESFFKKAFITRDQQIKMNTSYFVSCPQLVDLTLRLPDIGELLAYDEVAQLVYPNSLHHHIWIALNHKLSDLPLSAFEGLQYSVKNLGTCAAESLSILDLQAFIYCATLCAQSQLSEMKNVIYYNPDKPQVLPAALTEQLGTNNQAKFFSAAYKLYKNEVSADFGELRLLVIKGLEVVRCVGHHGLDVKLLVMLASIFAERSKKLAKQSQDHSLSERTRKTSVTAEIEYNDLRAELYWKTALPLLEKLKNNQAISFSNNRWFEYKAKEMTVHEICGYIEKGKLFAAVQLMKKKELDKALKIFEGLRDPYASFHQAQIYKQMADQITSHNKENLTSEMRSQHIIVLSRARDCLYLTLDRLREPSVDRNHPLNAKLGTEIENIERLLSRIDPDCINRNECDGMSDENVSSADSAGEHYVTGYSLHQSSYLSSTFPHRHEHHNIHSTPVRAELLRREARPSPERLDAQLRQLAATKDASISHILEQNKVMVESHRSLVEELRSFKDAVYNLTSTVDDLKTMKQGFQELKEVKRAVDELKASVDELQNFKNVTDVVYEMKRELADLKKDYVGSAAAAKPPNQLSDEDLCILDNEYGSDYNMPHAAVTPSYNQSLYPNYQGRMPGTYVPPLYPSLYSPMAAYAYGGLSLPQAGALAFSPEQQMAADLRAMQLGQVAGAAPPYGQPLHPPTSALGQALVQPVVAPGTMPGAGLSSLGQPLLSQVSSSTMAFPKAPTAPLTTTAGAAPSGLYNPLAAPLITPTPGVPPVSSGGLLNSNRAPPVNVVITSSDPLPSSLTPVPQKPLSVTIPPQHLKGHLQAKQPQLQPPPQQQTPHNYQIPLPTTGLAMGLTPSILSKPPPVVSTHSLLSNVAPPMYSAIGEKDGSKNVTLGLEIEKSLEKTFALGKNDSTNNSSAIKLNLSSISNTSLEEHDPCPDFKPIIPLPDEVPLHTGEEDEVVLFAEKTKLFRWSVEKEVKEWKERGVGILKILHNPKTNNVRLVMRRDQVHKICANHFLTADMTVAPMANNEKAYTWAAQDFADEQLHTEKFCARFKSSDEAKRFFEAFQNAQKILKDKQRDQKECSKPTDSGTPGVLMKSLSQTKAATTPVFGPAGTVAGKPSGTSLGGFVFTSTPTFEPKLDTSVTSSVSASPEQNKSPFSGFSFVKPPTTNLFPNLDIKICKPNVASPKISEVTITPLNKSSNEDSHAEDFEPNVEFKPVIPLPELVEVKTGEENAEVLFESRAKLLRYDTSGPAPEWKERGLGVMKVLKENIVRLVMRREQVHKVCCNHQVTKAMKFQKMASNPKAVTWGAQDFSEGTMKPETFALRFKSEELADEFLKTVQAAQSTMDDSRTGSDSREDTIEKPGKHIKSDPAKHIKSEPAKDLSTSGSKQTGFGDKFKPTKGSWECKICYIVNDGKTNYCMACDSPKNNSIPPKSSTSETSGSSFSFGVSAAAPTAKFSIVSPQVNNAGTPKSTFSFSSATVSPQVALPDSTTAATKAVQWGDKFKPAAGSWECQACFVRNTADVLYCLSCESPKDSTVPPKTTPTNKGISLDTGGQTFSFGIPSAATPAVPATTALAFGQPTAPSGAQFTFGLKTLQPAATTSAPSLFSNSTSTFSFSKAVSTPIEAEKGDAGASGDKFVFGSPQKHDFGFMAKSPRHNSSGQGDDDSDGSYEEEADNIYFKPVIPLPDKVDVVTGEEQEEVLYCHRAKLFRYAGGQWKERGLGDVKILRDKKNGRLRVVMRREQVLKICLNHILTPSIEYTAKDDKTWLFSAPDFSEGEIQRSQFCIRFKNAEIAQEFHKAISDALGSPSSPPAENKAEEVAKEDDSDVEFVSETKVTPAEEQEAKRLGLPLKFMAYRQLPDCTCDQCKKDDEYLGQTTKDTVKSAPKKSITPLLRPSSPNTSPFATPVSTVATPSTDGSVFGTPKDHSSMWSASSNSAPSSSPNLKSLLIKPPQFNLAKSEAENKSPLLGGGSILFSSPMFGSAAPPKTASEAPTSASMTMSGNLFGSKPPTTNIFGSTVKPEASSSPFSFSAPKLSSTFGATTTTPTGAVPTTLSTLFNSNMSIFSNAQAKTTEAAPVAPATTTASIFSTHTLSTNIFNTSGNLFGGPVSTQTPGSIFGASTNVFGNGKAFSSNSSIFGENKNPPSATPIFGASVFTPATQPGQAPGATQSVFGMAQVSIVEKPSMFGSPASAEQVKPIFKIALPPTQDKQDDGKGESKPFTFASNEATQKTDGVTGTKPGDDVVLKCDGNLSFATLAAKTSENAVPAFAKPADDKTPFAFLGAGTPVFASQQKKAPKAKNESMEGEVGENTAEEEYDPHYEPIVPLPEAIVVSTGEEDEVVEFNERAKLYRYDAGNKEWKERGVGQMKILHHPINKTYRFLLRREQVHKVVLNQLITPDLDVQPMTMSDKAWMWAGHNYTDDGCHLEQLAVRFKNCELAAQFREAVARTLAGVREAQADRSPSLPATVQQYGVEDVSGPEPSTGAEVQVQDVSGSHEAGDCCADEEEDDDIDDDDERSVMFARRCLLKEEDENGDWKEVAEGEVSVYYDPEVYASRIGVAKDDGECLSNTLIGMNTVMHIEGKECTWQAVEWADHQLHWRKLKVIFTSEDDAQEFHANYEDGVQCANQCNILDEMPSGNSDESED